MCDYKYGLYRYVMVQNKVSDETSKSMSAIASVYQSFVWLVWMAYSVYGDD